jgi:hypothetical protein
MTAPDAPGQADPLAAIAAEAARIEGEAAPPAVDGPPPPPTLTTAQELRGALDMARLMVAPMFGWWADFPRVWSDATLQGIAEAGGAVMDRNGWTMGGVWSEFGPYIALVGATAPPAFATVQAIKAHRVQLERQAQRPAPTPAPPPEP